MINLYNTINQWMSTYALLSAVIGLVVGLVASWVIGKWQTIDGGRF